MTEEDDEHYRSSRFLKRSNQRTTDLTAADVAFMDNARQSGLDTVQVRELARTLFNFTSAS